MFKKHGSGAIRVFELFTFVFVEIIAISLSLWYNTLSKEEIIMEVSPWRKKDYPKLCRN